ncbi:N-6 DNA methylase [Clostridium sp. A1-XYC3]|uniref:site-specific DNA-methyltransferase (adenine-specific) n=1 Tax=Clostridium tanneri TaxID=3037988 RepID=A0ABU4JP98_9CLOT|nr:N-6 DNA methylase [Clostridium sp. A1-XYC3]MDW8799978.1 N-6 DNA methylase [Clostridium sp. A1-XYC3]
MFENFMKKIDDLYNIILQRSDSINKLAAIDSYRIMLNIEEKNSFSDEYYKFSRINKEDGVVYTPYEIAVFIIENLIKPEDIINNPYLKILDPACGCGNLIVPCFKYLRELFLRNLQEINYKNHMSLKEEDITTHIIDYNLHGTDIDVKALKILLIDLYSISGYIKESNFAAKDFLVDNIEEKFDIFIGNPPYVGHKLVDREYSRLLKEKYKGIYKDKGDISYCFFKKAINNMSKKGKLSFITSRYFLESQSGEELRRILKGETTIHKIVDFYGIRPFKKVGIDPTIIFLSNEKVEENRIEVIKPLITKGKGKNGFYDSLFINKGNSYKSFSILERDLEDKGWSLISEKEKNIIRKIEKKGYDTLGNICNSYQGIITGCDKAFVIDDEIILKEDIEKGIVKPWIKSSFIQQNRIEGERQFLIYSNLIDKEEEYPNSIRYISEYKERLANRRECKKGFRKWYELQWGRKQEIFEGEKIIFPYKASSNRFALDKGSYFSADVYSLVLKEKGVLTYDYLLYILNSKVYEFYFKTFGKKLGEDLFEYYPNKLMELTIPYIEDCTGNEDDTYLYDYFGLTEEEIGIIE